MELVPDEHQHQYDTVIEWVESSSYLQHITKLEMNKKMYIAYKIMCSTCGDIKII